MRIADRHISTDNPYVIAEIGVNHDGDPGRAIELTRAAARAGADAIKLQYFQTDLLLGAEARLASYQRAAGETDPAEMLRRLELSVDQMAPVVSLAHEIGVHAIVTVFSPALVAAAAKLPWDAFKVASPDIVNRTLLETLAPVGLPMILSTGAADLSEVLRAREWLAGRADLGFLHCVSCYPTAPDDAFLCGIRDLASHLDEPVGYSDHTTGEDTGALACSLGASILEKHLTYDRSAAGPDHAASLEPDGLARYIELTNGDRPEPDPDDPRLGTGPKRVLPCETGVREVARQSLTLTRPIEPGDTIEPDHLTVKRPATGIEPHHLHDVVGRVTARAAARDHALRWEDLR